MNKDNLLRVYGECWGGEAGEWNTSLENKYLEYMLAKFLEENFDINTTDNILNIGIGAGYWDRYLSYKVPNGSLTSIDIDMEICDSFKDCLANENNTNNINVICADALKYDFKQKYNVVTLVGSAAAETGAVAEIIKKAFSLISEDGSMFLHILHKEDNMNIDDFCMDNHVKTVAKYIDDTYGIHAEYYKVVKLK